MSPHLNNKYIIICRKLAKTTSGVGWRFGGGSGASLIGLGCFGFLDSQCCSSRQLLPVLLVSFFRAAMPWWSHCIDLVYYHTVNIQSRCSLRLVIQFNCSRSATIWCTCIWNYGRPKVCFLSNIFFMKLFCLIPIYHIFVVLQFSAIVATIQSTRMLYC